ncbi:hypothetical protein Droror1_Dr00019100 [Drosera rotundifolia]
MSDNVVYSTESTESETLTDRVDTKPHQIFHTGSPQAHFSDDDASMNVDPLLLKRPRSINLQVVDQLPPPGLRLRPAAAAAPIDQGQGKYCILGILFSQM